MFPGSISKVKIANMALSNIGAANTIESFTENSVEAQQVNIWYDPARIQALEASNWSFARKRQVLALHSDAAPSPDWAYRYSVPADAVAIRKIVNPNGMADDAVPYKLEMSESGEEQTVLCNLQDATAVYTFNQEITEVFSSGFIQSLSFLLGHYLAYVITGDQNVMQFMLQKYMASLTSAAAIDANQEVPDKPREAEWIRGR